jgi:hypothetical protein
MAVEVRVHQALLLIPAVWVAAVQEPQEPQDFQELLTQAVAVAAGINTLTQVVQAVRALSFFATPVQFNISLVAQ